MTKPTDAEVGEEVAGLTHRQDLDAPRAVAASGRTRVDRCDEEAVVIEARDVIKTYRDGTCALKGVSFDIRRGECFGILGPNGAGKSTTVGILTTRTRATRGDVVVAGYDVNENPASVRRHIGLVAQTNTLDNGLSVGDNLVYHGLYFGMTTAEARAKTDVALEWAGLSNLRASPPAALSGGMSRRIVIARAIMHQPEVVFFDEPSAGLDPLSRQSVYEMVERLRRDRITTVFTTHYLEEADRLCDRIAVIDRGRVVVVDTTSGLRARVGAAVEVKLSTDGDMELLTTALRRRLGGAVAVELRADEVRLLAPERNGLFAQVSAIASDVGIDLSDLSIETPSLESVFLRLTERETMQ